jgi:serine/threonine protein kinase
MAADWWSVGVMVYEMICGLPCFRGDDLKQTYQRVLYGHINFLPEEKFSLPARDLISALLNRCLSACPVLSLLSACLFLLSVSVSVSYDLWPLCTAFLWL